MLGKMMGLVRAVRRVFNTRVVPLMAAKKHSFDLIPVQDHTGNIKPNDILLFCTLRNENFRIQFFLEYYRKLGVDHFCFVDNDSDDGFQDRLRGEADCSIWRSSASYHDSNFGMHWLNHLLRIHGSGHWCVTVDPDEIIVFPYCEQRNLKELTEFLGSEKRESFFCVLLDMYGDKPVSQTVCAPGQNPLEVAPYFDAVGYTQIPNDYLGDIWIQGGVRRRVFFHDDPVSAPAINKTPLVKWRWDFCYVASTHVVSPRRLNAPHNVTVHHRKKHLSPTGCLLHFKFLSVLSEKAEEEIRRKEHYDNSREYRRYNEMLNGGEQALAYERSIKFEGSRQLIDLGFMSRGQWF